MHACLVLLVASLAGSAIAAPMPIQSPAESPAPLKIRGVEEDAIIPAVENMKRQILERLDSIVLRSTPDDEEQDENDLSSIEKRRIPTGRVGATPNYKRSARNYLVPGSGLYKREPEARIVGGSKTASNYKREPEARIIGGSDSASNYKREPRIVGGSKTASNYKREPEARIVGGSKTASNYKREPEARIVGGSKTASNYKREPEARIIGGSDSASNYKREPEARIVGGSKTASNYRRDADEEDVASDEDDE